MICYVKRLIICFLLVTFSFTAKSADPMYEKALQSYQQQKYEESYIYLKNALQSNPKNLPAKLLLGKLFTINGYYKEAINELRQALEFKIDIELVLLPLGNVLLFNEQYQEVIDLGKGYQLSNESKFEWHMLSASAYANLDKPKLAAQEYQSALKINPNNTRVLNSLAFMYLSNNELDKAQEFLISSLTVTSLDHRTWHLNGKISEAKGELQRALKHYQHALQLQQDDPVIMRSLAYALISADRLDEAKVLAEAIIKQTPDDPFAMLLNSWLLSKNEEEDLASVIIENLNNKLSLVTDEQYKKKDSLLFVKGMTAYIQGNFEQARRSLSQYIKNYSHDINAVSMLVEIYTSMGQNNAAMHLLEGNEKELIEHLPQALKLADLYLVNGKDFKAEYWLAELRKRYPDNVKIILMSAKALIARQKADKAIELIIESEQKFPKNASLRLARGMMYMQTAQFDKALVIANSLVAVEKRNPDFWNMQAAAALRLRDYKLAEQAIENTLAINPEHFVGRFNQAMLFSKTEKLNEAKLILQSLVEASPRNTNAIFQLALVESKTGELPKAVERLADLSIVQSGNHKVSKLLLDLYTRNGQHNDALNKIRKITREFPLHPEFAIRKAEILIANRKVVEAKDQLTKLYDLWLNDPEKLYRLSSMQQSVEDYEGASETLQKALSFLPRHLLLNLEYARLNLQLGDVEAALSVSQEMQKQYGENANILLLVGDIHVEKQEWGLAQKSYLAAAKLQPNFQLPVFKLYELARRNVNAEEFHQFIVDLVKTNPESKWQRKLLADHLINIDEWQDAEPHYKKLLEYDGLSNNAGILNNLANIYFDKDIKQAQIYAKKALDSAPDNYSVLDTYGWILVKLQRYEDALSYLRQAHAIQSKDPSNRYHIAYTLHKLGRVVEAKSELTSILDNYSEFPERKEAEELQASF